MLVIKALVKNSYSKEWETQLIGVDCGTYGSGEYCWVHPNNASVQKFKSIQEAENFWHEYRYKGLLNCPIKKVGIYEMRTIFYGKKGLS